MVLAEGYFNVELARISIFPVVINSLTRFFYKRKIVIKFKFNQRDIFILKCEANRQVWFEEN